MAGASGQCNGGSDKTRTGAKSSDLWQLRSLSNGIFENLTLLPTQRSAAEWDRTSRGQALLDERTRLAVENCDIVIFQSRCGGAERCPLLHQPASLLKHVATPISLLNFVTNDVCKRRLDNLIPG